MGTGVAGRFEVCPSSASNPLPSVGFFWLMAADHNESRDAVMQVARLEPVRFRGAVARATPGEQVSVIISRA